MKDGASALKVVFKTHSDSELALLATLAMGNMIGFAGDEAQQAESNANLLTLVKQEAARRKIDLPDVARGVVDRVHTRLAFVGGQVPHQAPAEETKTDA